MNLTFEDIPWGLVIPLIVIHFILMTIALIDCIRSEETKGPKWVWLLVILTISIFGSVVYFVIGRRQD